MTENAKLPDIYSTVLKNVTKAMNSPPGSKAASQLISQSHSDLKRVHSEIVALEMFSPNETVDDITTRDLVYLSLPWVLAEVQSRVRKDSREERLDSVSLALQYMKTFISLMDSYNVASESDRELYSKKFVDPTKRRDSKIKQFKKEKELKGRIATLRKRQNQKVAESNTFESDFDMIASLLPVPAHTKEERELDQGTDEILRETTIIVLQLLYAQAQTQTEMMERELEMLKLAPASPSRSSELEGQDPRIKHHQDEAAMWRLDAPLAKGGPDGEGPLLDSSGRVLRPFTILPSDAGERARLQATVFGPDHKLPTMSIDEYLQIEQERGGIITGGGPASELEPTSKEALALAAEMDGSIEGALKKEEKRQKDEKWARFTDANPRGAGNTMNRG